MIKTTKNPTLKQILQEENLSTKNKSCDFIELFNELIYEGEIAEAIELLEANEDLMQEKEYVALMTELALLSKLSDDERSRTITMETFIQDIRQKIDKILKIINSLS